MTMATVAYKRRLFPVRFLKARPMARSRVTTGTTKFVKSQKQSELGNFSESIYTGGHLRHRGPLAEARFTSGVVVGPADCGPRAGSEIDSAELRHLVQATRSRKGGTRRRPRRQRRRRECGRKDQATEAR